MKPLKFIYIVFLFFILTPGVLVKFKGNKYIVALIHAIIFAIIYYFTRKLFKHKCNKEGLDLYSDSSCLKKKFVSDEIYDFDVNKYQYYFKHNNNVCSKQKSNGFYSDASCAILKNSISSNTTDFYTKTAEGCKKQKGYIEPTNYFSNNSCKGTPIENPGNYSNVSVNTNKGCKRIIYDV